MSGGAVRLLLVALALALGLAAPAAAGEERPTLSELEPELVCPSCKTTLDQSNSTTANQLRAYIRRRIAAGDTKSEIKRKLVAQLGPGVLAEPPKEGFDLLAWLVPLGGALLAAGAVGAAAWRWSRRGPETVAEPDRDPGLNGRAPVEPELERRLDEELARFE